MYILSSLENSGNGVFKHGLYLTGFGVECDFVVLLTTKTPSRE